jgi:carbamoyl-phosphate synthase large subunit
MPRRKDIHKILIIGSGPIVIGQACEFDYSGAQACKALRQEGYEIVLINSNPATIMTDPEFANRTYIEPITPEAVEKIIKRERPDAVLPTLGGQTALNIASKLATAGVFETYRVEMIGADYNVISKAEDRKLFKQAMENIGLDLPRSSYSYSVEESIAIAEEIGYPVIVRPSFTLGGTGGGNARNSAELERIARFGLDYSMINEVLIEESIAGWKEFELEVMRDIKDNVVIVCTNENLDPMGIHTGDSITVAPAQTLTDMEYQKMRDASIAIMREIGVETGGSNVQFAINPENSRMVVIEMNPRVSRSSALASKATGFPIAKIAAKLAVGYSLDEIPNDITKKTLACFEPTIDYCVVKIPRFTFEKFPEADSTLGVSMKSVGETMAIGRTFKEALQKGFRGLEIGRSGLDNIDKQLFSTMDRTALEEGIERPSAERLFYVKHALASGFTIDEVHQISKIDRWFLKNIGDIVELERDIAKGDLHYDLMLKAKQQGFSDRQIAELRGTDELSIRTLRKGLHLEPTYKAVDTCGAEFEAYTPYYYSTYESENEAIASDKKKIIILGGGPNRIGQGIEFDYCCCHASFALKELGYETIMVNSNPETVSTDYDTSDRLYFEPLTFEDVMNIVENEKPDGLIVQFGGQTPLSLANALAQAGVPIIGTSVESIDRAEDRDKFSQILKELRLRQTDNSSARSYDEAIGMARQIGYPVLVRPSYVLGGRAMHIVYDEGELRDFIAEALKAAPGHPILIDKFLEDAIEIDVDALSDGEMTVIGGIMEHIEEAGIHSGDSACVIPPYTITEEIIEQIREATLKLAGALAVRGLLNIQFAVKDEDIYVLEVNPRASRTVPFVSKATGVPLAKIASCIMVGKTLRELERTTDVALEHVAVKESVLPFSRFSGVDIVLGPEMKSTGEVMGIDTNFGTAFYKAQEGTGQGLPKKGNVFISVANQFKRDIVFIAKKLADLGFKIYATKGTRKVLENNNLEVALARKINDGDYTNIDLIKEDKLDLIINIPSGKKSQNDSWIIRSTAVLYGIPCITTLQGAQAAVNGIEAVIKSDYDVKSIQEFTGKTSARIVS